MKLTNHNKNNHYDVDYSVMSGTIEMNSNEFEKCFSYLVKEYEKAVINIDTYTRDSLSNVKHFNEYNDEGGLEEYFCWGVKATQMIAKKYKLNNYKNVNYAIRVTDWS
jgi:hypothetical protein